MGIEEGIERLEEALRELRACGGGRAKMV